MSKGFIRNDEFNRQVQEIYEGIYDKSDDQVYCTGYRQALRDVAALVNANRNGLAVNGYEALVIDITNDIKEAQK